MLRFIGRIIGWIFLGILGLGGLIVAIVFAGYIILWVLGILIGLGLLYGLIWLLVKLLE